ncbi:MAG: SDR family NAD(P)-dependent oxidoreductase, partial [Planctomycetales bacterium]|nr:SDR family NAD(P)-dependent oxidoreductase [Planctomycetales bacterium]
MPFSIDGHVALVTGSTTGLGKAIAKKLGHCGAKVALNYFNNTQRAEATLEEFKAAGIACILTKSNVTDESSVDEMFSKIERELGNVDIFVANATPDQPLRPIEEYDWGFYQSMLDFFV